MTVRKKTVDVEDEAVGGGGRGAIPNINSKRARVVASKPWSDECGAVPKMNFDKAQRLDGGQKMK